MTKFSVEPDGECVALVSEIRRSFNADAAVVSKRYAIVLYVQYTMCVRCVPFHFHMLFNGVIIIWKCIWCVCVCGIGGFIRYAQPTESIVHYVPPHCIVLILLERVIQLRSV